MKKLLLLISLSLYQLGAQAQFKYLFLLNDKVGSNFSTNSPEAFLSQRALDRRKKQNIAITAADIPVSKSYIDQLASKGYKIIGTSKWLNAVLIDLPNADISAILALPFIKGQVGNFKNGLGRPQFTDEIDIQSYDAGSAQNQLSMLGALAMHDQGYRGQKMLIGVFDSGFSNAPQLDVFTKLFDEKRVLDTYNFVNPRISVYNTHSHGTNVLSCIAADLEGAMIGTAPDASFLLYQTEDIASETKMEEVNWLLAAERADSAGVDVITTSLGYSDFDGTEQDYTYESLDGNTALISQAADWAASKGIIVVCSAGNEGNKAWQYVTSPADADSVIAVGAVDTNLKLASFSSVGPAADGRIKPDVAAKGAGTTVATNANSIGLSNGTSFSAPLIAGLVTGLWQAFPEMSAMEIRDILLKSGTQALSPDNKQGYGVPNFERAFLLASFEKLKNSTEKEVLVFPNPKTSGETLKVLIKKDMPENGFDVSIVNQKGQLFFNENFKSSFFEIPLKNTDFNAEIYFLKIQGAGINHTEKIVLE